MEPQSSIPRRTSGIPRPASRLPVLRPSTSQSQIRPPSSTEQLRKKPAISAVSKPPQTKPSLQKQPSRTSLARSSTPATSASANTSSSRASSISSIKRTIPSSIQAPRTTTNNGPAFKKPFSRPPSRQTRTVTQPSTAARNNTNQEEDELGDLDAFRSASRASSRAGFREPEPEYLDEDDTTLMPEAEVEAEAPAAAPEKRRARPSLSDRTIESLQQLQSSPAVSKVRRRSSFFNDNSMPPPLRPASALGTNRRPTTSDGTPKATPATPQRFGGGYGQRGAMTVPGKRSVSAANPTMTPSKVTPLVRPSSQMRKLPPSQAKSIQTSANPRPLSNAKSMVARTPKPRISLAATFGTTSPAETASPQTPSPSRRNLAPKETPDTARRVSSSSAAFRDQIAKAKAARRADSETGSKQTTETGPKETTPKAAKAASSSNALREQIAKAKEAARRAQVTKEFGRSTPPREVPAVTENEFGIEPDPAEIAEFDFGLDDPFNQGSKGSKSLLRKRIDGARMDGRLNIAGMGLSEMPEEVLKMYKYDPSDSSIAWGEVVDITTIIAADNELECLPEAMFPDIESGDFDPDSEEDGPQFGAVSSFDIHGNVLRQLPIGLKHLTQLTKLNLSRNQLPVGSFDVICKITPLRELRLAENALQGALPETLGFLTNLEVLELQGNKITSLPNEIQELTQLRSLNISNNNLKGLPTSLFRSNSLIELIANKNAFSGSFFSTDDPLPHLQHLQLANNSISALSDTELVLPALKSLNVAMNRLTALPDISSWTHLTTLMIGENKLTALPEGFVSLQQLRTADFTANDLTKIDERVALMESLGNLTLAANPLRERKFLTMNTQDLKRDLQSRLQPATDDTPASDDGGPLGTIATSKTGWQLKSQGTLDLSSQNLTTLDEDAVIEFSQENDIRQLYLQSNLFGTIPSILSSVQYLTVLDLSKNTITDPLSTPLHLPKLKDLLLSSNKLTSLTPLTRNLSAPALQTLDISNNRISGELPCLITTFPNLSTLKASDNSISEVTATSLKGLRTVTLSNNEIAKLDPWIGRLEGLMAFEVEGNRFRVPSYQVLRKGTGAVLQWCRDRIPVGEGEEEVD